MSIKLILEIELLNFATYFSNNTLFSSEISLDKILNSYLFPLMLHFNIDDFIKINSKLVNREDIEAVKTLQKKLKCEII